MEEAMSASRAVRTFGRCLVPSLVAVLATAGGCYHTEAHRVASYKIGAPPVVQVVEKTGVYKIGWEKKPAHDAKSKPHMLDGSARVLREGEAVSFATAENGRVVATVADEQFFVR